MNDQLDVPNRKPGRPRSKPRNPILSTEQVENLLTPAQKMAAEEREAERKRGAERRAQKKVLDSMSKAETIQEFWMESRKLADPTLLSKWQTRQEYVEALLGDLHTVLEGRSPDPEFIQDVDDELKADLAEFGEAGVTPILLIGKFWQKPNLLAQLTSGETPSPIFAKFGVLVALPDLKIHQWNEFMTAQQPLQRKAQPGNGYTTLQCACNAITGREAVPQSIADSYRELGKEYLCSRCRDLERTSRVQSTMYGGAPDES